MADREDLNCDTVKLARRIQSLTPGRMYLLAFAKLFGRYVWAILTPQGVKVERTEKGEK